MCMIKNYTGKKLVKVKTDKKIFYIIIKYMYFTNAYLIY